MKKQQLYYLVGLLIGFVVLGLAQMPSSRAIMVACDVGQGDAVLLTKGKTQVLIDGGPSSQKILTCLEKHLPFYDRTIELIVLTNTDYDHLNGLSAVVERYKVMQFVTADGVHESDALNKLIDALDQNGVRVDPVERGDTIEIGRGDKESELRFRVLWPPDTIDENVAIFGKQMDDLKREQILTTSAKRGNLNERSVVLLLLEGNKKILLTGDSGEKAEKSLLSMGGLPDIDILKVGHHGSKYASTANFLAVIKPETAIISVGSKNKYGHPTKETLERLESVGATIMRTDLSGEIVLSIE